jgi:hypothetical protein
VAGLPSKGATSLDARFCAVKVAKGDVMQGILSSDNLKCGQLLPSGLFLWCRSRVVSLEKTKLESWAAWVGAALAVFVLLSAAEAESATDCDVTKDTPPFIRHDLTSSFYELYIYGHGPIVVTNAYRGADMTDMAVVENLGSLGLTFTSHQVSALSLLESRQDSKQSNTSNVLAATNVVFPGGTLFIFANNNIFDFVVASDFAACTSNGPWGDTCDPHANTTVSLGGKIWT